MEPQPQQNQVKTFNLANSAFFNSEPNFVAEPFASAQTTGPAEIPAAQFNSLIQSLGGQMTPQEKASLDQARQQQQAELEQLKAETRNDIKPNHAAVVATEKAMGAALDATDYFSKPASFVVTEEPKPVQQAATAALKPPVKGKTSQTPNEPPKDLFTKEEKLAIIVQLVKEESCLKTYSLNSFCKVTLKTPSDFDQELINQQWQRARTTGDRRKYANSLEGYDTDGNPVKTLSEEEAYFNVDTMRSDRLAELTHYVQAISGIALPQDLNAKQQALRAYSAAFLDIIYEHAVMPFKQLIAEAKRDFRNF